MSVVTKPIAKLVSKDQLARLKRLRLGLESTSDPVTWRTLVTDLRLMMGSTDPDHLPAPVSRLDAGKKLIAGVLDDTYMEQLVPEVVEAVFGVRVETEESLPALDVLLYNGRHLPEVLLYSLADELKDLGKSVAVVNPVGHYNDEQTRIVGPSRMSRRVKRLVILASTQRQQGGSYQVLGQTLRLMRNQTFATQVDRVDVVIPMFGGSRGHREGQDEALGYEVLESAYYAKLLAVPARDLWKKAHGETWAERVMFAAMGGKIPKFYFHSVDVHDTQDPWRGFVAEGFDFESISPAREFSSEIVEYLVDKQLIGLPVRLVAPDQGAVERTEEYARELSSLLNQSYGGSVVDVVCMKKKRRTAGEVDGLKVRMVERWELVDGELEARELAVKKYNWDEKCVVVFTDDMLDTCGTAQKNVELVRSVGKGIKGLVFAATHGVFSQGVEVLDKVGADHYFVSNTLKPVGLSNRKDVTVVDVAGGIVRGLGI